MSSPSTQKQFRVYLINQAKAAQDDLDKRMESIPKACASGCDACCYQMVSVHTWEEELIAKYIENSMHAKTKAQVRKQLIDWWRYLKSFLRPVTRDNPLTLMEVKNIQHRMVWERVMCPFLVERKCSIYPVRPAICRTHVVPDHPEQCLDDPGRLGDPRATEHLMATFGPASPHLPMERYPHAMKPIAFAMTGVLNVPAPSTPMLAVMVGDTIRFGA